MNFLIWLLIAGGGFIIFASVTKQNPVTIVTNVLQGKN